MDCAYFRHLMQTVLTTVKCINLNFGLEALSNPTMTLSDLDQ